MKSRQIYALSLGKKPVFPMNHFYMNPFPPENLETQFHFWCIMHEDAGPILVDQGFTKTCLEQMNIEHTLTGHPVEMLQSIGIKAEDVHHVILTHLHWDHYAGDEFFPNATYYVHQKEIEYVTSPLMKHKIYSQHYNFLAVQKFMQILFDGKVKRIQIDYEQIFDGVACVRTAGHTPGLMSVAVSSGEQTKVICSDIVPRYQNIADNMVCGIHYDVTEALQGMETIRHLSKIEHNVLPSHDPEITLRYKEVAPNVHKIT